MSQNTREMLQTHPNPASVFDLNALAECIEACFACAQTCASCADACLGEREHLMHLVHCIRLNLDCADVCGTTGRVLSRLTQPDQNVLRAQLQACVAACRACGDECERHARDMNMEHCAVCAESCRRCEQACQNLLGSVAA
ncbi:four-helix bundle copper-binding protein [Deinococcus sp. YIM 77859]|uniref:four-helix bundle copper-binding protein n=1 Tax=Deinococcus sp. YIM 77859 TaxID=1540221 RepID=UPI0005539490|nr:four-helix bundle copper-binding protein [Deinococcus sp. YIM 77859]